MSSPWEQPQAAPPLEEDPSEKSGWGMYATQFFVVPLALVALCVGLFFFLRWLTYEPRTMNAYLETLQQTTGERQAQTAQFLFDYIQRSKHWQGLYDLSTRVGAHIIAGAAAGVEARGEKIRENQLAFRQQYPTFTPTILTAFENIRNRPQRTEEDARTLRYLAQMLGLVGDPEATPMLIAALGDADSALVTHAALALAAIGEESAFEPLRCLLAEHPDRVNRRVAALAMGFFPRPDATRALQSALADGDEMVQVQAALALAQRGLADGREPLTRVLPRSYLSGWTDAADAGGKKLGLTAEQQAATRAAAIEALARLGLTKEPAIARTLDAIVADGAEPPRVRDAAIKARTAKERGKF